MPQKPKYNLPDITSQYNVGKNIATLRKKHGLTQSELAEKIGMTQSLLSSYEIGRLNIPVEVVIQIAITLKVDTNVILGLKKSKTSESETDLKVTSRIKKIQELPSNKRRSLFDIIDSYLKANNL